MAERHIDLRWSVPATQFLNATQLYVDFEGAFRSQKSTALCRRVLKYCQEYPGIHCGLTRWTQDGLDAQLRPRWREILDMFRAKTTWNGDEEYDELDNGSRCYLRALKAAEDRGRYSKLAGLTLAVLGIDQAEEVPEDVYRAYIPARLSQIGYPHQVLLTPNPPDHNHWLTVEFPEDHNQPEKHYIHTSVYDNRHNLGEEYVESLERAYPEGTAQHRTFVLGLRGLGVKGEPVYRGQFVRRLHVNPELRPNPALEVCEAWDFGHGHPCVVWCQFTPQGGLSILGGVQGRDMLIYQFAPRVLEIRRQWFTQTSVFRSTCDPAGFAHNPQGTTQSVAEILGREFGIYPVEIKHANTVEGRNASIQRIGGYMKLNTGMGPAFEASPRFLLIDGHGAEQDRPVIVDALEAGYVWDDRAIASTLSPNTRRPKKDGFYDHAMNCLEYLVLAFAPVKSLALVGVAQTADELRLVAAEQRRAQTLALRAAQRDHDEADLRVSVGGRRAYTGKAGGRGGW